MIIRIIQILCLILGVYFKTVAQDIHFSQQYATRLHLNPAYAGLHADYSGILTYRNQWPLLSGAYTTNQFSGYHRLKNERTSAGLVMVLDKAGAAGLRNFQLGGIYAYQTNLTEKTAFSGGMQLTYGSLRVDLGELTFGDQLNDNGTINPNSLEPTVYEPSRYASISAGTVFYNNKYWFSLAGHHLNRPNIGFDRTSKLPAKLIMNGGRKFLLNQYYYLNKPYEWSITPNLTYTHQGAYKKIDLGVYTSYTPLTLGILYRGLPVFREPAYDQAVVLVAGIVFDPIKIGYSYDVPIASFGSRLGGAHEISLSFEKINYNKIFKKRVSGKNYKRIACPSF